MRVSSEAISVPVERVTLRAGLRGRGNALGIIRFLLAAAVIVSHGFPLSGRGEDPFFARFLGQENLGGVAVIGFFAISGYLITRSGMGSGIMEYLWRRALRIFPAFWIVLAFGAFVVGPIVWLIEQRPMSEYFTPGAGGPFGYISLNWQLAIHQWGIHDIFATTTPYGAVAGSVFNGSLWTLRYEWYCYMIVAVLVLFGVFTRAKLIVPALTVVFLFLQIVRLSAPELLAQVVPWLADPITINLTLIFLWGACFAVYADKVIIDDKLGLLSAAVTIYTLFYGGFGIFGFPAFAYLLMWLAVRAPAHVKKMFSKNDYSYGIYLYGFLVQQFAAYMGWTRWGYPIYIVISLVLSCALAFASWHLIEKRALALKDWGPGRGLSYWYQRARARFTRTQPSTNESIGDLNNG